MRILLTAGFDRALNVISVGELLLRDGHEICAVFVVSPYRLKRLRALIRQHGRGAVLPAVRRLFGCRGSAGPADPVAQFMADNDVSFTSIRRWCRARAVPRHAVDDLNSTSTIARIQEAAPDLVVYGGGGILRESFLDAAGRRVLNAHCGPLPEIRGMNACEWSLLLGVPPAVTIHWINEGIDTGVVLERIPIAIPDGATIDSLRSTCVVHGIIGLLDVIRRLHRIRGEAPHAGRPSRQCFVMAPVIHELLARKLATVTSEGGVTVR
jgi:methionyl-tRNA formyltransferase